MTDKQASRFELKAALAFWAEHHNQGSRNRVRKAIAYVRQMSQL
jgi:hypothetical protein